MAKDDEVIDTYPDVPINTSDQQYDGDTGLWPGEAESSDPLEEILAEQMEAIVDWLEEEQSEGNIETSPESQEVIDDWREEHPEEDYTGDC